MHMQARKDNKYRRMVVSLLSGGLAGATALCVSYPFDVARTRYYYALYILTKVIYMYLKVYSTHARF